jgi:5-hydroxyisourate hydrolase-like protein (transthyretin family)
LRAFGRLHHLVVIVIASLVGLAATVAVGLPAHAAGSGGISGTVTDRHGDPVQGVSVRAALVGNEAYGDYVVTDTEGRYELTGMPTGSFHVGFATYRPGGMRVVHYLDAPTRATATPVDVVDGGTTTRIDQTVDTGASIAGTVTGAGGTALSGVTVAAYKQYSPGGPWGAHFFATTGEDGAYRLAGLDEGTYRLGFTDGSGQHAPEYFADAASLDAALDIPVVEASRVVGKDAALATASHIVGTVTGTGGAPAEGVTVTAYQKAPGSSWRATITSTTTAANGSYDLGGLGAGTYRLGFSSYAGGFVAEYWNDAETLEAAQDVVVVGGATAANRDAVLATSSHITGTVTDPGGAGLPNVSVQAYRNVGGSWSSVGWTSTDAQGHYDLGGLRAGTYRVGFSAGQGGYVSEYWNDAATVTAAQDIAVGASQTVSGKDAGLTRGSSIAGTVTGPDGVPLPYVSVTAYQYSSQMGWWTSAGGLATTAADGTYEVTGLRAGSYRIGFHSYNGYISEYWDDKPTVAAATGIDVAAADAVTGKDAELATASKITGRVTGPTGEGVANVSVQAYQKPAGQQYWNNAGMTMTNGDGTYTLTGLTAGTYRVGFSTYQGSYVNEFWDDATTVEGAADIPLGASATAPGIDAVLSNGSKITGRVTGTAGAGLSGVNVSVYAKSPNGDFWSPLPIGAATNADGTYEVTRLPAGTYRIGFSSMQGGYIGEFWNDAATVGAADDIVVGASTTVADKNAQLATASRITGKVTGPDGAGLVDVNVRAYQQLPGQNYWSLVGSSTATRVDGTYDLGGLTAGTYRIEFSPWQSGHLPEYWDDAATIGSASDIVVAASATVTGKNAQLALGGHITGKVTGPDGAGLSGVYVSAYTKVQDTDGDYWSPTMRGTSTRPDGTYDLGGLEAGTYRIGFTASHGGFVDEFWDDAATVEAATDIVVAATGTAAGKDARLTTGGRITGTVTGPDDAGLANVNVAVYRKSPTGTWLHTARFVGTRPDGTYEVGGLTAGTYRLGFSTYAGGFAPEFWDDAATLEAATDIEVAESATVTGTDAQLSDGAHVTGRVTGADGTGLEDVQATVYRWSEAEQDWSFVDHAYTDGSGAYDIEGLAAGTYRLGFWPSDYDHLGEYWDDVPAIGDATDIEVAGSSSVVGKDARLAPAGHITGTVTATTSTADVLVTAYADGSDGWEPVWSDYVGPDGTYDVGGLRAGTYRIGFEDEAGQLATEFWNDRATITTADDIVVAAGATVTGRNASLVTGSTPSFENTVAPAVSGSARVGQTLTASPGTWTPTGASFAYQWLADGAPLAGATTPALALQPIHQGKRISVRVTAWGALASRSATSAATEGVAAAEVPAPTPTPTPTLTPVPVPVPVPDVASQLSDVALGLAVKGKPKIGTTIKVANLLAQVRTTIAYRFQWYAGSVKIKKATKSNLKVTKALRGKALKVKVTLSASDARKVVTLKVGKVR